MYPEDGLRLEEHEKYQQWRWRLVRRWMGITGCAMALLWGIWFLVTGSVPVVTCLGDNGAYPLPWSVSRLWDIAIVPLWAAMFILTGTSKRFEENENLQTTFVIFVIGFVTAVLISSVASGTVYGSLVLILLLAVCAVLYACMAVLEYLHWSDWWQYRVIPWLTGR